MTNFEFAFDKMIENEGGYLLHKNEGDTGGWTFAGIAENHWPNWSGWTLVKSGDTNSPKLVELVQDFYKGNFWKALNLHQVENKTIAYHIFDFAVNGGTITSAKLAQKSVGAVTDGIIGPKSIAAINGANPKEFIHQFAIAKINRYIEITDKNSTQTRFLRGWIKRTLNVLEIQG